jgi:hypothetical protein
MAADQLAEAALESAVVHFLGQSRAFVHQAEATLGELACLHDERAARLVEALELTTAEPARPGTLRHLERAASELVRSMYGSEAR